ncbi:MAG: FHA domain-containing protein [Planctomycetes bacterium]|nr:FHA domain-containing protein [Planctomycetota bacterium]MCW8135157.1 FHA domain-containing protein [Planctomycetota bacterium]
MALVVAVSRAGTDATLGEHTFGKEARAKGITFGCAPDCDVVVLELKEQHARLEKRSDGYYFVDLCKEGFAIEGKRHEGEYRVSDGTRILSAGIVFHFKRQAPPLRVTQVTSTPVPGTTATGSHSSLQSMSHAALKELSRYFVGEANFENIGEVRRFKALLQLTLEVAMEWMGKALRGRAEFQDQFSAPVTQLYAHSLNPLKKMQDISTIANFLLDWREERDIEKIRDTLRDAFTDMVKHQMGMLAGLQQFISDLQAKLDPVSIEEKVGGGKKAWKHYTQLYGDTFAESSKLFNELIYPSIRKGYIFSHDDVGSNDKG